MASNEAPFSLTFKVLNPGGFEYLVTLRPNISTPEEQFEALQDTDKLTADLVAAGYKPVVYSGGGGGFKSGGSRPAPQGDPDAPKCGCGVNRALKSGTSKSGKAWKGYACVNRKCDMEWING